MGNAKIKTIAGLCLGAMVLFDGHEIYASEVCQGTSEVCQGATEGNLEDTEEKLDAPATEFENMLLNPVIRSVTNEPDGVLLKWDDELPMDGYSVYRWSDELQWELLGETGEQYFLDSGRFENGKKYMYKVVSESGLSVETDNYYLAPVRLISTKSDSSKHIKLEWSSNKKATGYQILYKCGKLDKYKEVSSKNKLTEFKVDHGAKKYTVKIRVKYNADGRTWYSAWSNQKTVTTQYDKWDKLLDKYADSSSTDQLMFVKYKGGSRADIEYYEKESGAWECTLKTSGYVGRNGINKLREGDMRTPTGVYDFTIAFGIGNDPGAGLKYKKLNNNLYWCSDRNYYNKLVDIKKHPHRCRGEHLINYRMAYYYAMALDYNKKCTYKKGSAIFLHCKGRLPSTAGCIAIDRNNMLKVMKRTQKGAKICIYSD